MATARRHVLLLLVLALAVHAAAAWAVWYQTGRIDAYTFASRDSREYHTIAVNIRRHAVFSHEDESGSLAPDTWRTPGYPTFLAGAIAVVGESPAALIVVQQILRVLSVLMFFAITRRHLGDGRAFLTSLLFLVEPYGLYYSFWLLATTLFVTVLLATWWCWDRLPTHGGWGLQALLGVCAGALVLVRPIGILVPLVVLIGLLVQRLRIKRPATVVCGRARAWLPAGLCLALIVVIPAAWMTRNKVVGGRFALSNQGGVVLAYFKATEVELWRRGRTADRYRETSVDPRSSDASHTIWNEIDQRLQQRFADLEETKRATLTWRNLAQGNRSAVNPFVVSDELSDIGWSYLLQSPLTTAWCCLARCGSILTFPLNLSIKPSHAMETNRLLDALKGAVYLALCLAAAFRLARGPWSLAALYFPLATTAALLLTTTPQLDPRFRVPMIPLLLVIALHRRRIAPARADAHHVGACNAQV